MTKTLICYMEDKASEALALALKEKNQYDATKLSNIPTEVDKAYDQIIVVSPVLVDYNQIDQLAKTLETVNTQSIILISQNVSDQNNIFAMRLAEKSKKTIYAATYPTYNDPSVSVMSPLEITPAAVQVYIKKDEKHILTLIHDIEAFKKPRNTYNYEEKKTIPQVSMDTAIALSYLYTIKGQGIQGIDAFIDEIETNYSMSKVDILSIVEKNPVTRKGLENEFEKKI